MDKYLVADQHAELLRCDSYSSALGTARTVVEEKKGHAVIWKVAGCGLTGDGPYELWRLDTMEWNRGKVNMLQIAQEVVLSRKELRFARLYAQQLGALKEHAERTAELDNEHRGLWWTGDFPVYPFGAMARYISGSQAFSPYRILDEYKANLKDTGFSSRLEDLSRLLQSIGNDVFEENSWRMS